MDGSDFCSLLLWVLETAKQLLLILKKFFWCLWLSLWAYERYTSLNRNFSIFESSMQQVTHNSITSYNFYRTSNQYNGEFEVYYYYYHTSIQLHKGKCNSWAAVATHYCFSQHFPKPKRPLFYIPLPVTSTVPSALTTINSLPVLSFTRTTL